MDREYFVTRLAELKAQQQLQRDHLVQLKLNETQMLANLNAYNGAIEEVERGLTLLDEKDKPPAPADGKSAKPSTLN